MRILVPTAGAPPAKQSAEYIARIATRINAEIVVLHVYDGLHPAPDARTAFDTFSEAARQNNLKVSSLVQRGPIVETIIDVAENGDFALIVMGASKGAIVDQWISSRVMHATELPVVVIPHSLPLKGSAT